MNNYIQLLKPIYTKEPMDKKNITYNLLNESLKSHNFDPLVEFFLFMSNHAEHINKVIKPYLYENKIIFSDRYIDSRCAYQGATLKNKINDSVIFIERLHFPWSIKPDITFFIDIDIKTSIERCKKNRIELDKFENYNFLSIVMDNYKKIISLNPNRFIILNGSDELEKLEKKIVYSIKKYIAH